MRRCRVWVVTPALNRRGGTERSIVEQLSRWRDRFDIRVYTAQVDPGLDLNGLDVRMVPVLPGPEVLRFSSWFFANWVMRTAASVRNGRPDLVHSTGVNAPDAVAMSVHVVFSEYWERVSSATREQAWRGPDRLRAIHRILYWGLIRVLERRIYRGPATLWALSKSQGREIERRFGRPESSVPSVPHGVDTDRFTAEVRDGLRARVRAEFDLADLKVCLLVGNDAFNKGVDRAVNALALLPPDVVLAVAGSVDRDLIIGWARRARVGDRIRLWPRTDDVERYYAAADILVAPSRGDTFAQPVLEAMASGVPVVCSDSVGALDLVDRTRDVLVVEDCDSGEALASAIRAALHGPTGKRLSTSGLAIAKRQSWGANANAAADWIQHEVSTPRILLAAADTGGAGGIQRVSRDVLTSLSQCLGPDRVALVTFRDQSPEVPARRVCVADRSTGLVSQAMYALTAATTLWRWRIRGVSVVMHPSLAPTIVPVAKVLGVPTVVFVHGEEVWRPLEPTVAWSLRNATTVIAPSAFTAEQVAHWAGRRDVMVIAHPTPARVYPERARVRGRVLSVARIERVHTYKGVDVMLEAWPSVVERVPEAELVIVGGGDDLERMKSIAPSAVRFTGAVDDGALEELFATSELFALPSRTEVGPRSGGEGYGLVYLEAADAGLPVIAGNEGAVPEVVANGETGLLVDPRSPDAVAGAVVELLSDHAKRVAMGAAASALVRSRNDRVNWSSSLEALVRDLAGVGQVD
jgi:phosphatidyl-myo-inositol dimannoside synthase